MNRKRGLPNYPGSRSLHLKLTFLIILEAISIVAQATFLARTIVLLFYIIDVTEVLTEIFFSLNTFNIRYRVKQIQMYIAESYAEETGTELRSELMNAYFTNRAQTIQDEGTGRLVTLAIDGIEQLKTYLEIISIRILKTIIIPITTLIVIYLYDFISSIILIVTVLVVIIFMILL